MSLIKYIVILTFLFGLGFLILGLNSAYEYTYKNEVLSSAESAWQYSISPTKWPTWDTNIDSVWALTDSTFEIQTNQGGLNRDTFHFVSMQSDSFSWQGEWLSEDWHRQFKFRYKPHNVLCSLYIIETVRGTGFLNQAKMAFSIGNYNHQRDMVYDSLCVQLKKHYLNQ